MLGMGFVLYLLNKSFTELNLVEDKTLLIVLFIFIFLMGVFITWISTFFATNRFLNLHSDELYY